MTTETTDDGATVAGLAVLMRHLIDFAGLFPPARLEMAPMVRRYAEALRGPDEWMLGRVIVPVPRLPEFLEHAAPLLPSGDDDVEPWRISGLTAPAGDDALADHLLQATAFNLDHAGRAMIDVIELRATGAAAVESALDQLPDDLYPFFELPIDADPRGMIAALVGCDAGAKVRTGGVTADLYPTTGDLARFLHSCAAVEVPFKATAGLHHPVRHQSQQAGAWEFGFLNVFVAAAFAICQEAPIDGIAEILEETDLAAFAFADDRIGWRDRTLEVAEVEDARLGFAISFGSCSFDEPAADLRSAGLLRDG